MNYEERENSFYGGFEKQVDYFVDKMEPLLDHNEQ